MPTVTTIADEPERLSFVISEAQTWSGWFWADRIFRLKLGGTWADNGSVVSLQCATVPYSHKAIINDDDIVDVKDYYEVTEDVGDEVGAGAFYRVGFDVNDHAGGSLVGSFRK